MARKTAGNTKSPSKQSKAKSNSAASATATPAPKPTTPTVTPAAATGAAAVNGSGNSASRSTGAGGGVMFRLLFLLVPLLQMLWTAEAPLRPFGAVRDRETGELAHAELIDPRILIVAAHPRDALLFAPTAALMLNTERKEHAEVFVLALSAGADGAKEVREEWAGAWDVLGLEGSRRFVLDLPELKDNPDAVWDPNVVAEQVLPFIVEHNIDTILTFDAQGITGHPHHAAAASGVASLVRSPFLARALVGSPNPVAPRAYLLRSASPARNLGLLTPIIEHFVLGYRALRGETARAKAVGERVPTVFVSDVKSYLKSWRALLKFGSQMRRPKELVLWAIGRSMWVNEWVEV